VVHGGSQFTKTTLITPENLLRLEKYNRFAPLHNPHNVAGIKICLKLLPTAKNYALFDTAFHATIPNYASTYALPTKISEKYEIKKYGFHGINIEYCVHEAARKLKQSIGKLNLIVCHLGSGASITAVKNGCSIDTSMGFTPLEGLIMDTRSGDLDPAVVLFLQENGFSAEKISQMLNKESGLLGVSGFNDMRDILAASGFKVVGLEPKNFSAEQKKNSRLALEMFVYRIRKYIGAYFVALGQVDAIIFTAGIGERSAIVRKLILARLPFKLKSLVIPANEELMMAREIAPL
jgi:acetate kinase